ncbi:MAG: hypothetical protein H0V43_05750 [Gemmatimonadales bacterium]|nr:hypothetical protein [Gemmatimonadales bacterium]
MTPISEQTAMRGQAPDPDLGPDPLTQRVQATWTSGDFGRIAKGYERGAGEFIARLRLQPGEHVLDVLPDGGDDVWGMFALVAVVK